MLGQHPNNQNVDLARNLRENQLGGVIFGCKHNTIQECFKKQLFGLPSVHYSYVRNVKPGLPLFLFNYSDRMLHGIFEAASPGQMCIDPYAWSHDGTLRTSFPAQVRICTRTHYAPLMESQFKTVLGDNYYNHHHFYFELDHAQAKALIALFKSLGPAGFKQVPAVSSKRNLVAPLPSTKRQVSVIPDPKKDTTNSKDINPFSVLSHSSWADPDADNASIGRTSQSNGDDKESGELLSDWEDLDDNVLHKQFGALAPVECSHSVVNTVNGVSHPCDVNEIEAEAQNEPDGVGPQLERQYILKKLKELFVQRQKAEQYYKDIYYSGLAEYVHEETQVNAGLSSPDQHVPEETEVNTSLSCPDQYVPEETEVNASLSSPDQYVSEETQVNTSLSSPNQHVPEEQINASPCPYHYVPEEAQVNASLSSTDQYVPEEAQVNASLSSAHHHAHEETQVNTGNSCPDQYVSEEIQVNASLSIPDQHVPEATQVSASPCPDQHVHEETQLNAHLSCPDQYEPEEAHANTSLSKDTFGATVEDNASLVQHHGNSNSQVLQIVAEITKKTEAVEKDTSPDQYEPEEAQAKTRISKDRFDATVEHNSSLEQHHGNDEVLQIIALLSKKTEELEKKQSKSDQDIFSLREVIKDSGTKVQQLEYRIDELQFKLDSSLSLLGNVCDNLDKPSIFLIGGYNGVTWLSSLDSFSPEKDTLVPLTPMSSARSYASVAALDGCIFVFGGGDGGSWYNTVECYNTMCNEWMVCPCLNHEKGSLAGVSLDGKIYALGGGDGTKTFSEVEMFDPFLGKWICSPSMLESRFALAAAELNSAIYVAGGYDGSKYLQSAERYDPREGFWVRLPSMNARRGCHTVTVLGEAIYAMGGYDGNNMISSVEIFDPRLNVWKTGDPMSCPRGYASSVTLNDNVFVIGGLQTDQQIPDTVEVFSLSSGWSVPGFSSIGKRCFASAAVV